MQKNESHYNKRLKPLARALRNNSTKGEILLWSEVLRAKKMLGYSFNRQFAIKVDDLNIIVDFICRKLKLIIEIDGYSHNYKYNDDINRDSVLLKNGYKVIRISEHDVKYDLENVVRVIESEVKESQSPQPSSPRGS